MTSVSTKVPSGWVSSKFTELTVRESTLRTPKALKATYKEAGRFPVVDQGQEMVAGFTDDEELRFRGHLPVIIFGDHTRVFKFVDFPFVAGADGTRLIAPSRDRIDVRFFYYALCNLPLRNLGYSRHFKLLKEQMIRIPENLPEQRKIAAILSSVDDAIEKTQAVIDQVQVVKRGLLQELLTRGMPGRHMRFKQTEIGEIPEEWEVVQLSDVTLRITDGVHKTPQYVDAGIPFLSVSNLRRGRIDFSNCKFVSDDTHRELTKRCRPEPGDLLMGKVATLGVVDVVQTTQPFSVFVQLALIKPTSLVSSSFLKWAIRDEKCQRRIFESSSGTGMKYIGIGRISNLLIRHRSKCGDSSLHTRVWPVPRHGVLGVGLSGHARARQRPGVSSASARADNRAA